MAPAKATESLASLSPRTRERLRASAAADTANRIVRGSPTYVLMLIILAISSHAYSDHPLLMWSLTAVICSTVIGRIVGQRHQAEIYGRSPELWRAMTIAGVAINAICCGTLYGSFVILYGYERWTFVFIMVWITGTAAGALVTLTADFTLLRLHMTLNFVPPLLTSLYLGGVKGFCYAFAVLVFLAFLYAQGRYLHDLYWQQMIARELESERSAELDRARHKAEEASLAKSRFLAHMSHEIRTPMHGVLGVTDLLLNTELTTHQRQLLEVLNSSAEGLLHVINDVLDLSKVEAGKLTLESIPVNVRLLVREIQAVLLPRAQAKQLDLAAHIDDALPDLLLCDPVRLRQVLINLLGNAIKFTERGSVQLEIATFESDDMMYRQIQFSVRDCGIGIPKDKQASIFEAFSQADGTVTRRFGGTGLGLAISSQIVRMMGSQLEVESDPGKGSCFSFNCRLGCATDAPSKAGPPKQTAEVNRTLQILVAEDNPVNQMIVRRALVAHGHIVRVAKNGREAVEAALTTNFDVILMDHQMPELSGIEATRLIKAQRPAMPIIAVSANAMEGDRQMFLDAGMDGYVSKPFRLPDLLTAIAACTQPESA